MFALVRKVKIQFPSHQMPVEPPQNLYGSNNSGGFEPVEQQEIEVRKTI